LTDGIRTTYSAVQWVANTELASTRSRTLPHCMTKQNSVKAYRPTVNPNRNISR